jgi:hypothetical protein
MMRTDKNTRYLENTNYQDDEFTFSWDQDNSMIMPKLITCQNCHSPVYMNGFKCVDKKCSNCGYSIKMNGYPELTYGTQLMDTLNVPKNTIEHSVCRTIITQ